MKKRSPGEERARGLRWWYTIRIPDAVSIRAMLPASESTRNGGGMIHRILLALVVLFPISEMTLAVVKRSRGGPARNRDRGSMLLLWSAIVLGVALAFAVQGVPSTRLDAPPWIVRTAALVLMAGGLALRWSAILTLGRYFTVDVAVRPDHRVVQSGPYRFVRHPSYTGLLIAFLGMGVFLGNWLSILGLLIPVSFGMLNRVKKEEQALREFLGSTYQDYCKRTRRFIPGIL
jgi:protein-S-isoprenylcysteine O-methyltransferase